MVPVKQETTVFFPRYFAFTLTSRDIDINEESFLNMLIQYFYLCRLGLTEFWCIERSLLDRKVVFSTGFLICRTFFSDYKEYQFLNLKKNQNAKTKQNKINSTVQFVRICFIKSGPD